MSTSLFWWIMCVWQTFLVVAASTLRAIVVHLYAEACTWKSLWEEERCEEIVFQNGLLLHLLLLLPRSKLVSRKVREFVKTMTIWFQLVEQTFVCGKRKATTTDRLLHNAGALLIEKTGFFNVLDAILSNNSFQLKFSWCIPLFAPSCKMFRFHVFCGKHSRFMHVPMKIGKVECFIASKGFLGEKLLWLKGFKWSIPSLGRRQYIADSVAPRQWY